MNDGVLLATMRVRDALPEDVPGLARLAASAGGRWSEADFAGSVQGTARIWLVESAASMPQPSEPLLHAAMRPAFAAAIVFQPGPEDWDVLDLAVAPACRQRGLARLLLAELAESASRAGARRLVLEVREGNLRALAIYRAGGFVVIGRRSRYYPATPGAGAEDAIVMARAL